MAAVSPRLERRRPRPGSLERPVNGRLYRGTWLLVGLPLLVAAFSVGRPAPLPAPTTPTTVFDGANALALARELSLLYPNRAPGTAGAVGATRWLVDKMRLYSYTPQVDTFTAAVPGNGTKRLRNVAFTTDGGVFGGLGAEQFVDHYPDPRRILAVVNLDSIAGDGRSRVEIAGDQP